MIAGHVTPELEARLPLSILAADGPWQELEVVIDTGFNGHLTLPSAVISELGLTFHSHTLVELGDGSEIILARSEGLVRWHDAERDVTVLSADGGPLVGMALLADSRMTIDVVSDGDLQVIPLHK